MWSRAVILIFCLNVKWTQCERTELDVLKADILKFVLENEGTAENTESAVDILQFILGERTETREEDWAEAENIVKEEQGAPALPATRAEINKVIGIGVKSEDYGDLIGLYQDTFEEYNEIDDSYSYDAFEEYDSFQEDSNFEYGDIELSDYGLDNADTDDAIVTDVGDASEDLLTDTCTAEEASDTVSNLTVLDSLTFSMTGEEGSSATIELQEVEEHEDKVKLVCNFTTSDPGLVSTEPGCVPEIWLVSGHSDCSLSQLPDTVRARRLAEIHSQGPGQSLVDLSWDEVANTCVLIVRKIECEETSEVADVNKSSRQSCKRLISSPYTRQFSALALASVVVLLSGTAASVAALAPVSSLSVPSVSFTPPVYTGITYTPVNKWDTLPFLQLQGFDGTHAAWVAGTMFILYVLAAYAYFQYPRLSAITKRIRQRWSADETLETEYLDYQRIPSVTRPPPPTGPPAVFLESYSEFGDRLFDLVDNSLYQQESFFKRLFGSKRKNKKHQKKSWFF